MMNLGSMKHFLVLIATCVLCVVVNNIFGTENETSEKEAHLIQELKLQLSQQNEKILGLETKLSNHLEGGTSLDKSKLVQRASNSHNEHVNGTKKGGPPRKSSSETTKKKSPPRTSSSETTKNNTLSSSSSSSNKLKIYVYDLPYEYSLEKYIKTVNSQSATSKSNCDWNMNVCSEEKWVGEYSTMRQYGADAILVEKFRRYPNRVHNANDADLFVVPYPHSSICRLYTNACWGQCGMGCHPTRATEMKNDAVKMLKSLEHFNETTNANRHLFLLTADSPSHVLALQKQPLWVSLGGTVYPGSTQIVIPPPNTEPDYQPSALAKFDWTSSRNVSIFMHVGLVTTIREEVFALLEGTPSIGGLPVEVHKIEGHRHFTLSAKETWKKYRESYFCPILEGDMPYQKRFFDVTLSGCLPVVFAFPTDGDTSRGRSWFKEGWPGYKDTYPYSSSIDYSEFVVEIENITELVPTIETLLADKPRIQKMQSALGRVAQKFVYGLGDEFSVSGDAFDSLLIELQYYLSHLGDSDEQPAVKDIIDFCEVCLWANSLTCNARANYLMHNYKLNREDAINGTLKDSPQCRAFEVS